MRTAHVVLIGAVIALSHFAPSASAQGANQQRTEPAAAGRVQFHTRSSAERLATARTLTGAQVAQTYFNTPFSVTPRQPVADGRGWLSAAEIHQYNPTLGGEGLFSFTAPTGAGLFGLTNSVHLHLQNVGSRRFLVDCTVAGAQVSANTGSNSAIANAASGLVSVITSPGDNDITIASSRDWSFYGCEVTRIQ